MTRPKRKSSASSFHHLLTDIDAFKQKHCLRMHWRSDANDDEDMLLPDVWCCAFLPSTADPTVPLVATCGGNSVCFTDCQQGKVVAKYTHLDEPHECFHALAWTTLSESNQHLLAAAGQAHTIKILHYEQREAYAVLRGHTGAVHQLCFSRKNPLHLWSASADRTCRLWDVQEPVVVEAALGKSGNHGGGDCLLVLDCQYPVLSMVLTLKEDQLWTGNENAALCMFDLVEIEKKNASKKGKAAKNTGVSSSRKIPPTVYYDGDGWHTSPIDMLICGGSDLMISKGSRDKILAWSRKKTTPDSPFAWQVFNWPDFDAYGCMGKLVQSPDETSNLLFIGELGAIRVYQVNNSPTKRNQIKSAPEDPIHIMADPQMTSLIRCVDVSSDFKHIVAVDAEDCVWIWSREESL